jgi:hypothetical protein
MKKILVLLLALAMVGGAFAQVVVTVGASGSDYVIRSTAGASDPISSLSPNGSGSDILTIKAADKDNKYGVLLQDRNLFSTAAFNMDAWNVWYDTGLGAKVTVGNLSGGSYTIGLTNGFIGTYSPNDKVSGNGLLVESNTLGDLTVGLFMPQSGGKAIDTTFMASSFGLGYVVKDMVSVSALVNLGLASGAATDVNVGFDGSFGVAGLDAYGFVDYSTATATGITFGVGGQFKQPEFRAGLEFEGNSATKLAYDVVANVRYYVMPTFFVQIRPMFYSTSNGMDGRYAVRALGNYALGNGLSVEVMGGYDAKPAATASASPIYYAKLGYSVSF